jgi:hypothetical protein
MPWRRSVRVSRSTWSGQFAAAIAFALLATGCGASPAPTGRPSQQPNVRGLVIGGILPCRGIAIAASAPRYAAGTVAVLRGQVGWKPVATGATVPVLPDAVVAQETVTENSLYRFELDPGQYVFQAHYDYPSVVVPFIAVTVKAGDIVRIDIPNNCI